MRAVGIVGLLTLLAGCASVRYLDKPRTVTVSVPVVQKLDPAFLADCAPSPLQGTSVGAALERLASSDTCLTVLRAQLAKLRALQNEPAVSP
jgi:hypothetical protein